MIEQDQQLNEKIRQKNIIREIFNLNPSKNRNGKVMMIQDATHNGQNKHSRHQLGDFKEDQQYLDELPSTILNHSLCNPNYHTTQNQQSQETQSTQQAILNAIAQNLAIPPLSLLNIAIDRLPAELFIEEGDSMDVGLQTLLISQQIQDELQNNEQVKKQQVQQENPKCERTSKQKHSYIIPTTTQSKISSKENTKEGSCQDLVRVESRKEQKQRSISNCNMISNNSKKTTKFTTKIPSSSQNSSDKDQSDLITTQQMATSALIKANIINKYNSKQSSSLKNINAAKNSALLKDQLLLKEEALLKDSKSIIQNNKDEQNLSQLSSFFQNKEVRSRPLVIIPGTKQKTINNALEFKLQLMRPSEIIKQNINENSRSIHSVSPINRRCSSFPRVVPAANQQQQQQQQQPQGIQEQIEEVFSPKYNQSGPKAQSSSNNIEQTWLNQQQKKIDLIQEYSNCYNQKQQLQQSITTHQRQYQQEELEQKSHQIRDFSQIAQDQQQMQLSNIMREMNMIHHREQGLNAANATRTNASNGQKNIKQIQKQQSEIYNMAKEPKYLALSKNQNNQCNQSNLSRQYTKVTDTSNLSTINTHKQQNNHVALQKTMSQINIFSKNMDSLLSEQITTSSNRLKPNQQLHQQKVPTPLQKMLLSVPFQQEEICNPYNNYYTNFSQRLSEILNSDISQNPSIIQKSNPQSPPKVHSEKENFSSAQSSQNQIGSPTLSQKPKKIFLNSNNKLNQNYQNQQESGAQSSSQNSQLNTNIQQIFSSMPKLPYVGKIESSMSQHNLKSDDNDLCQKINQNRRGQSSAHITENMYHSPISSYNNLYQSNFQKNTKNNFSSNNNNNNNNNNNELNEISRIKYQNENNNSYFRKLLHLKSISGNNEINNQSPENRVDQQAKDKTPTTMVLEDSNQKQSNIGDINSCQNVNAHNVMRSNKRYYSQIVSQSQQQEKQKIQQYAHKIQEVILQQKKTYQQSKKNIFA